MGKYYDNKNMFALIQRLDENKISPRDNENKQKDELEAEWDQQRSLDYKGPTVNSGKLEDHYERLNLEDQLGEGYGGNVFKVRKRGAGPASQVFAAKRFNEHAYWTIDHELPTLRLTNNENVVKLYDVFDRRDCEEDRSVFF